MIERENLFNNSKKNDYIIIIIITIIIILSTCSILRKLRTMKPTFLMRRPITSKDVILQISRLYTLTSVFLDATCQQILGSKTELDDTRHNQRQSQIATAQIVYLVT